MAFAMSRVRGHLCRTKKGRFTKCRGKITRKGKKGRKRARR